MDNKDLAALSQTCESMAKVSDRERARREIEALQGPLRELEKGSYVMGPEPGEPDPWHNETQIPVKIQDDLEMGAFRVRQDQYEKVMGKNKMDEWTERMILYCEKYKFKTEKFIGSKKPISLLDAKDREEFLDALNKKIEKLWPIAYPGKPLPEPWRFATEEEWEYATTRPLPKNENGEQETKTVSVGGKDFKVTAIHQRYPNGNDEKEALPKRRAWAEGSRDEDKNTLKPNDRGFYDMGGEMWEATHSVYIHDPKEKQKQLEKQKQAEEQKRPDFLNSVVAARGGARVNDAGDCRSSSRYGLPPEERVAGVALRVARKKK